MRRGKAPEDPRSRSWSEARQNALARRLECNPIVHVITIERTEDAVALATTLVAGGIRALDITLRTEAAFETAAVIVAEVPEAIAGIGTIVAPA